MADPIFRSATFDEAMAQANADGVWLVVAASSAASEPSRMMDRTTWTDDRIVAWFEGKAVAMRFDVDAQPELARALKVESAPTVIAFRDGEEKDRIVGFLESTRLLMWLVSLGREQKTPYDDLLRRGDGDLERDMHGRLSYAKQLLHEGQLAKATEHYVWLWHNIERVDPDMSGVRVSFMAGEIKTLVEAHPPARVAFGAIRDETGAAADAAPAAGDPRLDWVVLNNMLGEEDRTIAWYDGVKADPNAEAVVRHAGRFLIELLKTRGRWADVGRMYRNPLKELAFHHDLIAQSDMGMMSSLLSREALAQVQEVMHQQFRKAAAELYASLHAAGRKREMQAVHDKALELDPSDEMKRALADSPIRYD